MRRWGTLAAVLTLFMVAVCLPASAQYQRAFGWCEQGGHRAVVNGVQSSNYVQQSFKACTVTVFNSGTTTRSVIFNDSAHTLPLANPFTATSNGFWAFYAANGTYDVQFSGAGITVPFSIAGYQLGSSGGGGGGGGGTVGPGTTNRLSKFTSATTIGNSVCSDDGINPTVCPGFSISTNALFFVKPNNGTTGTTANLLVARDGTASQAVQNAQTTDTDNVIGIAGFGAGTSGSVSVAFSGQFPCIFDNPTAVGDWVILGSGSQCHDIGASQPAGIETVGRVNSVNSGAGTLAGVDLGMPDVTSTSTGGGTGVVSTVVCTGPLGTYTAPGNTITGDCNTSDDGAGNLHATSYTATGTSAGFFASQQGTAPTLSTANSNYFYADTSVVNTFGTAWPVAPGTLGQALVVSAVPDATHIKLGYSNAGCAQGTCVINAPTADQTIAGAHQLINRGVEHVGVDLSGLSSYAQTSLGALPNYIGESFIFHPSSATNAGFSVWDESTNGPAASYQASYGTGQRVGNEGDSYTTANGDVGIGVYGYAQVNSNSALDTWAHYGIATSAATGFSPGGTVSGIAAGYYADANLITLTGGGISAGFYSADQGTSAGNYGIYIAGGKNNLGPQATTVGSEVISGNSFGAGMTFASSACETAFAPTTLSTIATTTDTGLNCLPANSIIDAVVARVTTTITAACTGWELGDATTPARFSSNNVTLTSGTTTDAAHIGTFNNTGIASATTGTWQAAAAKVRITCAGGNPGAGAIRVIVYYHTWTAPTS